MADPVILTEGLVKRYGRHPALHGLDLAVRPGEVFGFLGPNGAGKTTTLRLLLDLLRPTHGTVRVLGQDPRTGPVVAQPPRHRRVTEACNLGPKPASMDHVQAAAAEDPARSA